MYITQLSLDRFRGTQQLSLDLNNKVNVFVGMNGAGKSTILDATAILLSWLVNRIKQINSSGKPITESDIRNNETMANLKISLLQKNQNYTWNIAKNRKGYIKKDESSSLTAVSDFAKKIQIQFSEAHGKANIPIFVYYPVNRAVVDIPLRIKEKHRFDLLSAFDDALISGANFRTFFEWFREREDLENENRRYLNDEIKPEDFQFPDPQLEAVRNALEFFMPEFTHLTVKRNPLRMEVKKQGEILRVNQLSDGEKCLMAMVGDLARRMAIANPYLNNPLTGEGIILIDEVDLHLHPKWQRILIEKLTYVFPNCQFLLTTHSPHIITHTQPDSLFLLNWTKKGLECVQPLESYGKSVERVLEDLMQLETTRPQHISESLKLLFQKISENHLTDAKNCIESLKLQIGDDPELTKASILIKRKELIGK